MKKNRWLAPSAVLCILLIIYAKYQLFPFGEKTIAWCDMKQQVIPLLLDLKNILCGKSDMFLNLNNAGGMSFWGVFLFFLSSPFSFLIKWIPAQEVYYFVNILLILKMMICAYTSALFFEKEFSSLDQLERTVLSVLYAFGGYALLYYQNIVWLDMMYLFPLFLLAFFRLVRQSKPGAFISALCAVVAVNFYLSYMVVVFLLIGCGIYFYFLVPNSKKKKSVVLLAESCLISAFITSAIWMPSMAQYVQSARSTNIVQNLKAGRWFTMIFTTLPIVSCSSILVLSILCFFCSKKFRTPKTSCTILLLFLMLVPLIIDPINKMWHTGSYQAFPSRYGYITLFLGLILTAQMMEYFSNINYESKSYFPVFLCFSIYTIFIFTFSILLLTNNFTSLTSYQHTLWVNSVSFKLLMIFELIIFISYTLLLIIRKCKLMNKKVFIIFLCIITGMECFFNGSVFIGGSANDISYNHFVLDLQNKINDNSLYRVKNAHKSYDVNLTGAMGYNTLNHYTSFTDSDFMFALKKMGYSSYWMETSSSGGTKLTDALLGNKYTIIKNTKIPTDDLVKEGEGNKQRPIYQNELFSIYQNKDTLPMGFLYSGNRVSAVLPETSRLDLQEKLYRELFPNSTRSMFIPYKFNETENMIINEDGENQYFIRKNQDMPGYIHYNLYVNKKQNLYFDLFYEISNRLREPINRSVSIKVNGKLVVPIYPTQGQNGIIDLGVFEKESVSIEVEFWKDILVHSFGVFGLDNQAFYKEIKTLKPANLHVKGNKIYGKITSSKEHQHLFVPVSYHPGVSAKINGKRVPVYRSFDTFFSIDVPKGTSNLEITYWPKGLIAGCICSILGFLILLFFMKSIKKSNSKLLFLSTKMQNFTWYLYCIIGVITFLMIYIFPIVVRLYL